MYFFPWQLVNEAQFEPEQEQKMRVINSAYSIFQFKQVKLQHKYKNNDQYQEIDLIIPAPEVPNQDQVYIRQNIA